MTVKKEVLADLKYVKANIWELEFNNDELHKEYHNKMDTLIRRNMGLDELMVAMQ